MHGGGVAVVVGRVLDALRETVLHLQDQMYTVKASMDRAMVNTTWGAARARAVNATASPAYGRSSVGTSH